MVHIRITNGESTPVYYVSVSAELVHLLDINPFPHKYETKLSCPIEPERYGGRQLIVHYSELQTQSAPQLGELGENANSSHLVFSHSSNPYLSIHCLIKKRLGEKLENLI